MPQAERDRLLAVLPLDFEAMSVVELGIEVSAGTEGLLLRQRLRASDAVQIASCLYLKGRVGGQVRFVAFGNHLTKAARAEGLEIED